MDAPTRQAYAAPLAFPWTERKLHGSPRNPARAVRAALPERDAIDQKRFTACVERALEQSGIFAGPRQAE